MIALALALSAGVVGAAPAIVDLSALDHLSQPPPIQSAQLAPDGQLIYVLDGVRKLRVYRTDTLREVAGPLDWPRSIFSFYPTNRHGVVAGLEVGGGAPRVIVRDVLDTGTHAGKAIELSGRIAGFSSPQGGDLRVLTQASNGAWASNQIDAGSGVVASESLPALARDFAFAPGNRPVAILTATGAWSPIACAGVPCQDVTPTAQQGFEGVINGLADGSGLNVWVRTSAGTKAAALWTWESAEPRPLASVRDADVSDVLVDPESGAIQAVAGGVFDRRWHAYDPRLGAVLARIKKKTSGFPQVMDRTPDGSAWLIADVSDERPPVISLYVAGSDRFTRLPGQADVPPMPRARTALIKARDGVGIPIYLSPPVSAACDSRVTACGLVALIHGGPQRRDERHFSQDVALLQKMGLWVLRVNYRGSDGFGERFVARGDGEWGRRISHDVVDSLQWAASKRGVDRRRMCVAGESFGGFTAVNVASLRPDLIACAASLNGGGELEGFAAEVVTRHPELTAGLARQLGDPGTPEGLSTIRSQSPMSRLDALRMPLLLAYGSADDTTPTVQTTGLVDALAAREFRSFVSLTFTGERHVLSAAAQRHYRAALANFLANTIGARAKIQIDEVEHAPQVVGSARLIAPGSVSDVPR